MRLDKRCLQDRGSEHAADTAVVKKVIFLRSPGLITRKELP